MARYEGELAINVRQKYFSSMTDDMFAVTLTDAVSPILFDASIQRNVPCCDEGVGDGA